MADPANTSSWWLPSWASILQGHLSTPYDWSKDDTKTQPIIPPTHAQSEKKSMADFDNYLKTMVNAPDKQPLSKEQNPINWGAGAQGPARQSGWLPKLGPQGFGATNTGTKIAWGGGVPPTPQPVQANTPRDSSPQTPSPQEPAVQFPNPPPLPPRRQPDQSADPQGMHKVWYSTDKSGGIRRAGVGDTPPPGVSPDSFDYEPNQMTGWQRFVRGAYDFTPTPPPKAEGGAISAAHKIAKEAETPYHHGIIHMAVGGRTDHLPMNVLEGSYVLPADIVSGLGEGNTLAGSKILDNMFKMGPAGTALPNFKIQSSFPRVGQAPAGGSVTKAGYGTLPGAKRGGEVSGHRRTIPIIAAGGEYVVHPDAVREFGGGDLDKGHEKLDHFVKYVRAHTVKTLKKLPGPKKN